MSEKWAARLEVDVDRLHLPCLVSSHTIPSQPTNTVCSTTYPPLATSSTMPDNALKQSGTQFELWLTPTVREARRSDLDRESASPTCFHGEQEDQAECSTLPHDGWLDVSESKPQRDPSHQALTSPIMVDGRERDIKRLPFARQVRVCCNPW